MLVLSGGMMVLISSLVMTESDTSRPVLMCPLTTSVHQPFHHGLVKRNRVEIDTRLFCMDLIANGSHAVKEFVSDTAHEMLGCVHAHVSVSSVPVNGTANFIANNELMFGFYRVMDIASAANFLHVDIAVGT